MTTALDTATAALDAMGRRDYDEVRKLLDPAVTYRTPFGDGTGVDFFLDLNETFLTALPDMEHEITDSVAGDDTVAWELRFTGTHTGPLASPAGTLPPTGRPVTFDSCDYIKVVDGRVVSWHIHMDAASALGQLAS